MPNRDTYKIVATVQDDYQDEPAWEHKWTDAFAPDQEHGHVMADMLRAAALTLRPEDPGARSSVAIWDAVFEARRRARTELAHTPATRDIVLGYLEALGKQLGIDE